MKVAMWLVSFPSLLLHIVLSVSVVDNDFAAILLLAIRYYLLFCVVLLLNYNYRLHSSMMQKQSISIVRFSVGAVEKVSGKKAFFFFARRRIRLGNSRPRAAKAELKKWKKWRLWQLDQRGITNIIPNLIHQPRQILVNILMYVGPETLNDVVCTCTEFRDVT